MIQALARAVGDLGNRQVFAIMLQALVVSVAVFIALAELLVWLVAGVDPCSPVGLDGCPVGAAGSLVGALALTLICAWFLFPAVAIAVITGFADRICSAVENAHYPDAARGAHSIGLARGALLGLKSATRLVAFNLIALPFYILLLITGVGPLILFVVVNGIAFGRDLGELAAARHGDKASQRAWLKRTRGQQHLIGFAVSVLFLVPFANLLAPVIGTAAAIHLFHRSYWLKDGIGVGKGG